MKSKVCPKNEDRKPYEKPEILSVELVPDEAVVLGCWNCGNSSGGSC